MCTLQLCKYQSNKPRGLLPICTGIHFIPCLPVPRPPSNGNWICVWNKQVSCAHTRHYYIPIHWLTMCKMQHQFIRFVNVLQNFLAANSQCWWNASLIAATRALRYVGHVYPGMLLVTAEPCALEIMRNAYARSVLKPPANYSITFVGKYTRIIFEASTMYSLYSVAATTPLISSPCTCN